MNRKLKRTLPYLQLLKSAPDKNRREMLKAYPTFVADDMVEILYNILLNNVTIRCANHKALFNKNKSILMKIGNQVKNRKARKTLLYGQKGGFLGAVIPILTSVLGGLVSSAL